MEVNTVMVEGYNPQEILPALLEQIKDTPEYEQMSVNNALIPSYALEDSDSEYWKSDEAFSLYTEVLNVLDSNSPDGYYFGSNDKAQYGYWPKENNVD